MAFLVLHFEEIGQVKAQTDSRCPETLVTQGSIEPVLADTPPFVRTEAHVRGRRHDNLAEPTIASHGPNPRCCADWDPIVPGVKSSGPRGAEPGTCQPQLAK